MDGETASMCYVLTMTEDVELRANGVIIRMRRLMRGIGE